MYRKLVAWIALAALVPGIASAAPFGGETSNVTMCYNTAIYANVGSPRGGQFIWTPSTVTYRFGPPSHSGQWLLGLSGIPYYCLVSILPIIVWTGIDITMMGSSQ